MTSTQSFVNSLPFPAFICTNEKEPAVFNQRCEELLGFAEGWEERIHRGDKFAVMSWWKAFCVGGTSINSREFRWMHPTEGLVWLHVSGSRLADGTQRILGRMENTTSRKKLEARACHF